MDQHQWIEKMEMVSHHQQRTVGGEVFPPFNFKFCEETESGGNTALEDATDEQPSWVTDLFCHTAIIPKNKKKPPAKAGGSEILVEFDRVFVGHLANF